MCLISCFLVQAEVNIDAEVHSMAISSPFIVVTKRDDDTRQYFVCVERMVLLESTGMTAALMDIMSVFFTFNIAYPKQLYSLLLFVQHHVFSIKDNQPVPNVVKIVFSALFHDH